ncbi:ABC transporter ATP-binding protein, partial [Vagococcus silagei]
MQPLIEFKEYQLAFEQANQMVPVIRGIDLAIYPGETLAIIGESGSGKSVLCRSLLRLFQTSVKTEGQILFKGEDILDLDKKDLRQLRGKKIAMIFQDPMTSLNPVIKVGKQIRESILEHQSISKKAARAEAILLMKELGISDAEKRYHHYPHQFSGGQRQRIVIAMAVACRPEVLIADEATTALDPTTQAQILALIKTIQKKYHMTVLLVEL